MMVQFLASFPSATSATICQFGSHGRSICAAQLRCDAVHLTSVRRTPTNAPRAETHASFVAGEAFTNLVPSLGVGKVAFRPSKFA